MTGPRQQLQRFLNSGARILVVCAIGIAVAGCLKSKPVLLEGDVNGVQITYGGDINDTIPVARAHCAQFERVPRLLETSDSSAYYQCDAR